MQLAIGFIETDSLFGAVEASNAMAKVSDIVLIGKEVFTSGSVTVKIIGEKNAVNSAIEAGTQAVQKLNKNVSSHIIVNPDEQLLTILPEIKDLFFLLKKAPNEPVKKSEIAEPAKKETADISLEVPVEKKPAIARIKKSSKLPKEQKEDRIKEPVLNFKNDTIRRLRAEALGLNKKEKKVKEKKVKVKKQSESDLESLNVHQLRKLARSTKNFPIQGREISKASRGVLLNYLKNLK
jgi:ethanolamine utilization protein EutM